MEERANGPELFDVISHCDTQTVTFGL